jgi:serine/threonine protein kinase
MPHPLASGGVVANRLQVERSLTTRGRHLMTFLAKDKQNGQQMVLKELRDDLRSTPQAKQDFQDEVQALMGLSVPGVQPVRGVVAHEGRSYLALGFLPGQTLRSVLLKQPRLTVDQALTLLRTVASILQNLHDQFPPMLHLDVQPENILLAGWDKVVLLDGSWLRRLGNPLSLGLAYNQAYAAPETIHGQSVPASDLYSLGVTIVESLTGTPASRLFNPNVNRLTWDPIQHPLLQEVLVRMTEGSLSRRFSTASQVLQAFAEGTLSAVSEPNAYAGYGQAPPLSPPPPPPPPPPVAAPVAQPTPAVPPAYQQPKMTSTAMEKAAEPAPAPPPPPSPPPPPPAPPPVPKEPPKIVENIDDVSTEEGLDALMALYEAQNS